MYLKSTLAAVVIAASAVAANAASVDYTFDFTGLSGQTASQLSFTSPSGLNLTVDGLTYQDVAVGSNAVITGSATTTPKVYVGINNNGLGVCEPNKPLKNCKSGDQLDGGGGSTDNEMLRFSFSGPGSPLKITSVTWWNNDTNDLIDLFIGSDLTLVRQFNAISPPDHIQSLGDGPLSVFALGVRGDSDQVRVAGLTVTYEVAPVPLPASALLLLGGVGGFAALRRRKKS